MVTDRYQHILHHPTVEEFVEWSKTSNAGKQMPIIAIDNQHPVTRYALKTFIQCPVLTAMRDFEVGQCQTGGWGELPNHLSRLITGAIVHDQPFYWMVIECLRCDGLKQSR
jgi:hypothetical protein